MKKEKVKQLLKKHQTEQLYARLTREFGYLESVSCGFILDVSEDFVLLQETDDFSVLGYQIFPIKTIKHLRYNKNDKTYHQILKEEGLVNEVKQKYSVDLTSWQTLTEDIMKTGLTIISECEHPKHGFFCIGQIKNVNKKSISIHYFNAQGILDKETTKNKFEDITKLSFDDHYANVFAKYVK